MPDYRGIPLKRMSDEEIPENVGLSMFLVSLLWPLGEAEVVGSFKKRFSFHDIDIVVHTEIDTERTFLRYIREKVIPKWRSVSNTHIDLFIYGNFKRSIIKRKHFTLYFNKPERQRWIHTRIIAAKFCRSLLKV